MEEEEEEEAEEEAAEEEEEKNTIYEYIYVYVMLGKKINILIRGISLYWF